MPKTRRQEMCDFYITPDERSLLARVAGAVGIGRDYLALRQATATERPAGGRPLPRWLGRQTARREQPAAPPGRTAGRTRYCHTCAQLSAGGGPEQEARSVCGAHVWTRPMRESSVHASLRLRRLSLTCALYQPALAAAKPPPRHCRACRELAPVDAVDERYVCRRNVWINPMKPQSVANSRRLTRLSAACPHFAPRAGGWLPRSARRRFSPAS